MKILTFSDLHLEFGKPFTLPHEDTADLLILAGDIVSLTDYAPLDKLLRTWPTKPVLYVLGNHEYYTKTPMKSEESRLKAWLEFIHPNVTLLLDESVTVGGVNFFGGTMWTDFDSANAKAMGFAHSHMSDYFLIRNGDGSHFKPQRSIDLHAVFVDRLTQWFDEDLSEPRVVITHNAPVFNPLTVYRNSPLAPAFNSLDMIPIINRYQPALWVYGHTHECDDQMLGNARVISNQRGYPKSRAAETFECKGFDPTGTEITI